MNTVYRWIPVISLLTNMHVFASSDDLFPGKGSKGPMKLQLEEDEKEAGIICVCQPSSDNRGGNSTPAAASSGLAIVKRLVMAFEGEVRVESSLGHGSTFRFSIPFIRN